MHPWEFDEYTFAEFLQKREGYYKHRRDNLQADFQHFRIVAFWAVFPHLTKAGQRQGIKIIPDIYAPAEPEKDLKVWYEAMRIKAKERAKSLEGKLTKKPSSKKGGRRTV
jgi:hypothetical protein